LKPRWLSVLAYSGGMDGAEGRMRAAYRTEHAAEVLGVKAASLRALAKRRRTAGSPVAWERDHPANPTDSYLFPVEFIDARARQEALDRGLAAPERSSAPRLSLLLPDLPGERFDDAVRPEPLVDAATELDLVKDEAKVERSRREEVEALSRARDADALVIRSAELETENAELRAELRLALGKVEQLAELLRQDAQGRRAHT